MTQQVNKDLVWRLGEFSQPEYVLQFLKRFEESFCVYSPSVGQLYSNYDLMAGPMRTVVTLPRPYSYHDNFYNIPQEAVIPTGMVVSPGEAWGRKGWLLCYRSKKTGAWRAVALDKGLELMRKNSPASDPFLPVIQNKDLRKSTNSDWPLMHLHRISVEKLQQFSQLQRSDISRAVSDKISTIAAA